MTTKPSPVPDMYRTIIPTPAAKELPVLSIFIKERQKAVFSQMAHSK